MTAPQTPRPRRVRAFRAAPHAGRLPSRPAAFSTSFQLAFGGAAVPALAINPAEDRAFVRAVMALAESCSVDGLLTPAALETALRLRYPQTSVRPRDLTAEASDVWYVYRDGRWSPPVRRHGARSAS